MTFEMIVGALPRPGESADPGKPNTLPAGTGPDPASRVIHASPRLAVSLAAMLPFGFDESSFEGQDHGQRTRAKGGLPGSQTWHPRRAVISPQSTVLGLVTATDGTF